MVLNWVVQYFPDVQYLLRVLQGAVGVTKDGGKIFIGDVRHLGLLRVSRFGAAEQGGRSAQCW